MTIPCEVIDCLPKHLNILAPHLRPGDTAEVLAMGLSPKKALWSAYRASHIRRTYLIGGEVAAVGGCGGSLLAVEGSPWLLTSPLVERDAMGFAREARKQARDLLEFHSVLRNFVDARYTKAVQFLRIIGFTVGREERMVSGSKFISYEMVRAI